MLGFHSLSERPISALTPPTDTAIYATIFNAVTFAQTLDRLLVLNPELWNGVTFSNIVQRNLELTLSNLIEFHHDIETQFIVLALINDLALTHSISRQLVASRLVQEVIRFEQRIGPTHEGDLENLVTFLNEIARGDNPENEISFSDEIEATTSKGLENEVSFEDQIDVNIEVTRELDNEVSFEDSIIASIERPCELHEYAPSGNGLPVAPTLTEAGGISFIYGLSTLNLRNPEFGDETLVNPTSVLHRTRNGTMRVYRNSLWGKRREFRITVRAMSEAKKDEVLDFLEASLGQQVTYIDPENRSWTGVLIEPQSPVEDSGPNCDYQTTIRFRGVPV